MIVTDNYYDITNKTSKTTLKKILTPILTKNADPTMYPYYVGIK
jgi:hypothetical protein